MFSLVSVIYSWKSFFVIYKKYWVVPLTLNFIHPTHRKYFHHSFISLNIWKHWLFILKNFYFPLKFHLVFVFSYCRVNFSPVVKNFRESNFLYFLEIIFINIQINLFFATKFNFLSILSYFPILFDHILSIIPISFIL